MSEILDLLNDAKRHPELAAIIAEPVGSLPALMLSRTLRRDLDRRIAKRRVETIRDLLYVACEPSLPPETRSMIAKQTMMLRSRATIPPKKPEPPAPTLRAGMTPAEISAWAKSSPALQSLVSRGAHSVVRLLPATAAPMAVPTYDSLSRLLLLGGHMPKSMTEEVVRFASSLPEHIADAARYSAARAATRASPPADPVIRRAWEFVRAAHSRLPPVAFVPRADIVAASITDDPPSFVLRESSRRNPFAGIDLTCGRLDAYPDAEPIPELMRAGLDYALDLLTSPSPETLEMLLRVLARPTWERNLTAIVRASVGKVAAPDEDKREIGWRIRA